MNKVLALFVIITMISIVINGCITSTNEEDEPLKYTIGLVNFRSDDVTVAVFIDDEEVTASLLSGWNGTGEFPLGILIVNSDLTLELGTYTVKVVVKTTSGSYLFNDTLTINIFHDFDIKIEVNENRISVTITEELPEKKNNHAPKFKNGQVKKWNNVTYNFSVIYIDEDGDEPSEAKIYIYQEYYDGNASLRFSVYIYNLDFVNGTFKNGAQYFIQITSLFKINKYKFAFSDGYERGIPIDDTPSANQ